MFHPIASHLLSNILLFYHKLPHVAIAAPTYHNTCEYFPHMPQQMSCSYSRLLLEDWHLPVSTGFCLSSSLYPPALCLGHTKLPLSWSTLAPRFRIDTCSSVLFFLFVIISFPLFRFPDAHVHIPLSIHISYYIVFVCACVVLSC